MRTEILLHRIDYRYDNKATKELTDFDRGNIARRIAGGKSNGLLLDEGDLVCGKWEIVKLDEEKFAEFLNEFWRTKEDKHKRLIDRYKNGTVSHDTYREMELELEAEKNIIKMISNEFLSNKYGK